MNITTTYKTNHNGRSQILAKGGGKQRTISFDAARSFDYNHGAAAGILLRAHFGQVGEPALTDLMSNIRHEILGNGKHRFSL